MPCFFATTINYLDRAVIAILKSPLTKEFNQTETNYANIGAIITPPTVPAIAQVWGWKWAFILTGLVGLIRLIFRFILYEVPKKHKKLSQTEFD